MTAGQIAGRQARLVVVVAGGEEGSRAGAIFR
jgi:hypothetical protein